MAAERFFATRHSVQHDGRTVYEWEQSYGEVDVFVAAPPGVRAAQLDCSFQASRLRLGLKGNPPFMEARRAVGCVLWRLTSAPGRAGVAREDVRVLLDFG